MSLVWVNSETTLNIWETIYAQLIVFQYELRAIDR
jgi:hypothetical protein